MRGVLRCFGGKNRVAERIRAVRPSQEGVCIINSCLDNAVYFEEIDEDAFYDISDALDDIVYNDCDKNLEETLVEFLSANGLTLSVAESCTGGLLSAAIINVPGASKVFYEGIVAYHNGAKENRLGVENDTLMAFGAVSKETAMEMASGLITDNVDITVSTTGIAGPHGGSEEKPVGLVYIGIATQKFPPVAVKSIFSGNRENVRKCAKNAALFYVLQYLKNNF